MTTLLLTFGLFLVVILAMAVGYIFQKKAISGSCGGLGSIGVDKACDCPEPCDNRKKKMAKAEAKRKAQEAVWKENRIL
ncbi:(Na+)-NQR maturation NqrM [Gallaecimonas sp. GXIMD4217]|uniref:(Na+)-NQR maturation NqrM n=1 Tax=Gallaecimonas sp. GXIMD4217 TaxID=3131927 RepID=UPI00311AD861